MGKVITIELIRKNLEQLIQPGEFIPVELTDLMRKYSASRAITLFAPAEPASRYTADIRCECGRIYRVEGTKWYITNKIFCKPVKYYLNLASGKITTKPLSLKNLWFGSRMIDGKIFHYILDPKRELCGLVAEAHDASPECAPKNAEAEFARMKKAADAYYEKQGKHLWDRRM